MATPLPTNDGDNHSAVEDQMKNLKLNNTENGTATTDGSKQSVASNNHVDGKSHGSLSGTPMELSLPTGFSVTSSRGEDEAYNMNHANRGHCVVFNHKHFLINNLGERNGTNVDRNNVNTLFEDLGFQVKVYNDRNVKQIKDILDSYAFEVDHAQCDCFVVVFMSHGEEGHLYGKDNLFKSELLFSHFTADQCPTLAGKPKMFFIQACRGEGLDAGVTLVKSSDQTDSGSFSMYKIPTHADFLVSYSTVPGHYSWRNTSNGSWFVQSIVRVFREYANTLDVLSMMTYVNRYMILNFESNCPSSPGMHGKKQTASISSTLMRLVHLKPKQ